MNFLTEFQKDFWGSAIPVRPYFSSPEASKFQTCDLEGDSRQAPQPSTEKCSEETECCDVVRDLVHRPVASACLPIAKQIATSDQTLKFKLPQIGDLFIGILHLPIISQVNFTLHNYSSEFKVEGLCQSIGSQLLWTLSDLPLPLVCVSDWTNCYIDVEIQLMDNYSLQSSNQEVFKAFYGYCQRSILYQIVNQALYNIPLHNGVSSVELVCGLWTITSVC